MYVDVIRCVFSNSFGVAPDMLPASEDVFLH